jgi:hypothetical protein
MPRIHADLFSVKLPTGALVTLEGSEAENGANITAARRITEVIRNYGLEQSMRSHSSHVFTARSAAYLLFICHDDMQPRGYGPLKKKQMKCLERERANNPEVMPSSPMNKCKMQKQNVALPFPVQQIQKAAPSSTMPFPSTVAHGGLREGSFVVRTNRHGCARFLLARLGIWEASCR